ncbi:hypothetical protein CAAN3_07S04082 [[Candida] anglica]
MSADPVTPPPPVPAKDDISPRKSDQVNETHEDGSKQTPPKSQSQAQSPILLVDNTPLTYDLNDDLSTISISRQLESYRSPHLNENSDLFAVSDTVHQIISRKLESLNSENETNEINSDQVKFWISYLEDTSNANLVRNGKINLLEQYISNGIPQHLRGLIYLKTLQVRYKLTKENYNNLLKKALNSPKVKDQNSYFEALSVDQSLNDNLKIFTYITSDLISTNSSRLEAINSETSLSCNYESTSHLPPNGFVVNVGKLLQKLPNLEIEDGLFLLLKFNKIYLNLIKDEFFYKANRSLEQISPKIFLHISKQGIDLNHMYKKTLGKFFEGFMEQDVLIKLLDFVLFEGFDFIIRFYVSIFAKNGDKLMKLDGDNLQDFINGDELFKYINTEEFQFEDVLKNQPDLIKYENEYHLLHANSLNHNNNELANLKEVNEDLNVKILDLKKQLENLKTTHSEIIDQSTSYTQQLNEAQDEKLELNSMRDKLKLQYENLSMKENVKNTIRANKEFSIRNSELEEQIDQIKGNISRKREKLAKLLS